MPFIKPEENKNYGFIRHRLMPLSKWSNQSLFPGQLGIATKVKNPSDAEYSYLRLGPYNITNEPTEWGNSLKVIPEDNTLVNNMLVDNTIDNSKLLNKTITNAKIADGTITTELVKDNSITTSKFSSDAVCPKADGYKLGGPIDINIQKVNGLTDTGGFKGGEGSYAKSGAALGNDARTEMGGAVGWKSYSTGGGSVGKDALSETGGSVGLRSLTSYGGSIGNDAYSGIGFSGGSGAHVKSTDPSKVTEDGRPLPAYLIDAIQLGTGTNATPKTLQVYDHTVMNPDGTLNSNGKLVATHEELVTGLSNKADTDYINKNYATRTELSSGLSKKLDKTGGTVTGNLMLSSQSYLKISAKVGYGTGEAKIWYNSNDGRLYLDDSPSRAVATLSDISKINGNISDLSTRLDNLGFKVGEVQSINSSYITSPGSDAFTKYGHTVKLQIKTVLPKMEHGDATIKDVLVIKGLGINVKSKFTIGSSINAHEGSPYGWTGWLYAYSLEPSSDGNLHIDCQVRRTGGQGASPGDSVPTYERYYNYDYNVLR